VTVIVVEALIEPDAPVIVSGGVVPVTVRKSMPLVDANVFESPR
jgi:hypothetical protein